LNKKTRSKLIADMIQDAYDNEDVRVVYVVCGGAHSEEIFHNLDKRCKSQFTFISKPSSADE
jgi:hypothetical protein